jgi:hypothetical protein
MEEAKPDFRRSFASDPPINPKPIIVSFIINIVLKIKKAPVFPGPFGKVS